MERGEILGKERSDTGGADAGGEGVGSRGEDSNDTGLGWEPSDGGGGEGGNRDTLLNDSNTEKDKTVLVEDLNPPRAEEPFLPILQQPLELPPPFDQDTIVLRESGEGEGGGGGEGTVALWDSQEAGSSGSLEGVDLIVGEATAVDIGAVACTHTYTRTCSRTHVGG